MKEGDSMYKLDLETNNFSFKDSIKGNDKLKEFKNKVYDLLYTLTDWDYNGDNGEEYFINGKSKLNNYIDNNFKSCFSQYYEDIEMYTVSINKLCTFIKKALYQSKENDSYYYDTDIKINYNKIDYNVYIVNVSVADIHSY